MELEVIYWSWVAVGGLETEKHGEEMSGDSLGTWQSGAKRDPPIVMELGDY